MSEILDSGNRREFESGAVRDIAEGKGRMDLLPLDIVAELHEFIDKHSKQDMIPKLSREGMFWSIHNYMKTGDRESILYLLWAFIAHVYHKSFDTAIMEVSVHYEEGAKKYVERNWEKGIPCHCYIDSALRHGLKYFRCDLDERHDRAFIWNLLGLLWTVDHKPEFNDLPFNKKKDEAKDVVRKKNLTKASRREEMDKIIEELKKPRVHKRKYYWPQSSVRIYSKSETFGDHFTNS